MSAIHYGSDMKGGGGHLIPTNGAGAKLAIDCIYCKCGTLEQITSEYVLCIDCGMRISISKLINLGIVSKTALRWDYTPTVHLVHDVLLKVRNDT